MDFSASRRGFGCVDNSTKKMPQRSRRSSSGGAGGEKTPNASKHTQYGKAAESPSQASGRTSPSTASAGPDHHKAQIVRDALQEASAKYPGFISRDAFEGSIVEVEPHERAPGATLWMSEEAMFAHSLSPGSAVAISVAVSKDTFSSSTFPLEPLASLCSKHYDIECEDTMVDEIGTYFAVAVVWPSRKLLKNGIRLSRQLSNTMGNPSLGRNVYVVPLHIYSTSKLVHRVAKMATSKNDGACRELLWECNDLNLKCFVPKSALRASSEIVSRSTTGKAGNSGCENEPHVSVKASSGYQSRVMQSDDNFKGGSPLVQSSILSSLPQTQKGEGTLLHTGNVEKASSLGLPNWAAIRMVLEDEKLKELLQRYAMRWLSSRILLRGNFVAIPVCGQMCAFLVTDAKVSPELMHKDELHPCRQPLVSSGFLVGYKTNINFLFVSPTLHSQYKKHLPALDVITRKQEAIKPAKHFSTSQGLDIFPLGGLSEAVASLKEIINFSLLRPHTLERLGLQPTRGVLLFGPPGTGKTSLVSACAYEVGVNMFPINGPEIVSEYYGESEQALQAVFQSAGCAAPSVVFIDELDAIAPTRKDGSEDLSQRMVAALLALMDGIDKNPGVLIVAATNRPESIDPALRRPGRLDREIEIGVPSPSQRLEILQAILHRMNHSLTNDDLHFLSSSTHGFVGADLSALCNEAAMSALRRYINIQSAYIFRENHDHQQDTLENTHLVSTDMEALHRSQDSEAPQQFLQGVSNSLSELSISENSSTCYKGGPQHLGNLYTMRDLYHVGSAKALEDIPAGLVEPSLLKLTLDDFKIAKMKVRPSAMREVMLEVPKVCWGDIGGQDEVKQQLKETVEWPQKHQDAFLRIGTHAPRGVLMFGPPGCSKTLMARAVASEAGLNFLAVKGPELFSKWVGESEKAVRSLFSKARAAAPAIIFFDEIDGLAVAREHSSSGVSVGDRVMSQLLVEMDGLNPRVGVTVIAATNRPDKIDAALLRPGRFDRLLYVGPPNEAARKEIFDIHTRKMACGSDLTNLELASLTNGYTGADVAAVCREAAIAALEENIDIQEVSMRHFKAALARVQPSDLSAYEMLCVGFQRHLSSNVVHRKG